MALKTPQQMCSSHPPREIDPCENPQILWYVFLWNKSVWADDCFC